MTLAQFNARARAAAAVLFLAGCAATPNDGTAPPARDPGVAAAAAFSLEGRVAVRYGAESLSGRIVWTHSAARDEIGLSSPLGNQLARLERDERGVTLTDSNQDSVTAPDAESLTRQRLGWRLPLAGLTDWVRGRPRTDTAAEVRRDGAGRIAHLAQSDWRIEYAYDDAALLPRRLVMQYRKADEPLEIRLAIDRWQAE